MSTRGWTASRLLGLVLLVLAVSPVTAPFSACDLAALFGSAGSHGYTVPSSKSSTDHAAAAPAVCGDGAARDDGSSMPPGAPLLLARARHDLSLPLRI